MDSGLKSSRLDRTSFFIRPTTEKWPISLVLSDAKLYIITAIGSFISFSFITCFISPLISRYFKSYSSLSPSQKCDWETRIASNIHAIIVGFISLYCLFFDAATNANPIWNDAPLVRIGISITMGYITADFFIILYNYRLIGDNFMLVHHLMAMTAYIFVVIFGILPFFANFRQLAELSTVFVNQRWYYSVIGQPHTSRSFLANAWLMVISFFFARVIVIPYYYYRCYIAWDTPEREMLGVIAQTLWILTSLVLDVLNVYWMGKMIRGGIKILSKPHKKKT
ncbi:TLC domain-containing protein 4-A-like [Actinia tenebrosa]|uniref:TLC domain-containing protein 4-A-like n=1 Tax=Actinia tenebrosa TaxID=6105 RepID=A0A6P8IFA6_ACTTE|nr:TLC domain-containing protein 4-A-like [Actinia tenebrosa]